MKYGLASKPSTSGNTTFNATMERIHQVLGNLVQNFNITQTYFDKDDSWSCILAAAAFEIISTEKILKGFSLVQLLFFRDMILLIKLKVD